MSQNAIGEPSQPVDQFIHVSCDPIEPAALYARAQRPEVGAVVQFCGTVRNHNRGARVLELEYDAYVEMARDVISGILGDAFRRWPFWTASAVHRTGAVGLSEVAVCITVGASHRDQAFAACRHIIDALKSQAPIWKRETLESGGRRWLEEGRPPTENPGT